MMFQHQLKYLRLKSWINCTKREKLAKLYFEILKKIQILILLLNHFQT